jgi:Zn-dependent M28 family amino/carboxypeptidase
LQFLRNIRFKRLLGIILANAAVILILAAAGVIAFYFYCIRMPGEPYAGPLPSLSAESEQRLERMRATVRFLAHDIGERNPGKPDKLEQAAEYIEQQFRDSGYVPNSENINAKGQRNIVVDLYGKRSRDRILLLGAHYDSSWMTPGADDNASGVAALLEIARAFRDMQFPITIRFVAFANEEFPYFGTSDMGSLYHAQRARDQREKIVGMFSLEMLGYYSDAYRSQYYPKIIRSFYPRRGNFIAFVSNTVSRPLLVDAITLFRERVQFPSQGLAAPQWLVRGVRRSDHASFWANGFQAVMITDTANYRNYGYHNAGDTHDTLDYERMTLVVDGIMTVIEQLAQKY